MESKTSSPLNGRVRITLIVGREDGEREPFIVGALNTEYLAQLDMESSEAEIHKLKETWTGDVFLYDWREIDCLIDYAKLEEAFGRTEVVGEIE